MSTPGSLSLFERAVRALRKDARVEPAAETADAALQPGESGQPAAPPATPPARPAPRAVQAEGGLRAMRIQRIRARDLAEALERASRELGPDALVLSREPAPGGGVTVAFGVLDAHLAPPPPAQDPGLRHVRRLLERTGVSAQWIEQVARAVEASGQAGAFAVDAAAQYLGQTVPVAPSPRAHGRSGAAHVLAFVGPTGVGKTATLVKLAARLVRAGRRVALVAMDTGSVGGRAQLEAYGRLLQTPVSAAADGAELARQVELSRHLDLVLVDTSGRSPRDGEALRALARELASARLSAQGAPSVDVYLTVSATSSRASLDDTLLAYDETGPTALVLTKFDETRQPAALLEFASASGLPAAFLCDGAEISRHLHRTTSDRVADLFLRGRIA